MRIAPPLPLPGWNKGWNGLPSPPKIIVVRKIVVGAVTGLTRKQEAAEQSRRKASLPALQKKQQPAQEDEEEEGEEEVVDQCPEPNGYFPDAEQCDKYYDCRDGKVVEKVCPDGLVFNDFSPQHEKCDLPFGIDCANRPKLRKGSSPISLSLSLKRMKNE